MTAGEPDPHPGAALVDPAWYLATYPDIAAAGAVPERHYLQYGWKELRDPNPWFSTRDYLARHPDLRDRDICPTDDFTQARGSVGVRVHPEFDADWYAGRHLGTAARAAEAAAHFVRQGAAMGLAPHPALEVSGELEAFRAAAPSTRYGLAWTMLDRIGDDPFQALVDGPWYVRRYGVGLPDPADAARHYRRQGWRQGYDPCRWFSTRYYLHGNPSADPERCPLDHFVQEGAARGRRPHPAFHTAWYARRHLAGARPSAEALRHFLTIGLDAGLAPHPAIDGAEVTALLRDTPPDEREPVIRQLYRLALLARATADSEGEVAREAGGVAVPVRVAWIARGVPAGTTSVLVLAAAEAAPAYRAIRTAARLLPPDETPLVGLLSADGGIALAPAHLGPRAAMNFALPRDGRSLRFVLATLRCRRATALGALGDHPTVAALRELGLPFAIHRPVPPAP